jgi:hypothetical protein
MAQSYLIFDFGANEDSVKQARLRLDGWRQAFHLTKKLEYNIERKAGEKPKDPENIRFVVRLVFSDHEKLSHQRWLDRIPMEPPFKDVEAKIARQGESDFAAAAELFDSLDTAARVNDGSGRTR